MAQAPRGPRFKNGKDRLAGKSNREKLLFEEPGRETLSSGHHQPDFVPVQRSAVQTRYQGAPPSSSSGGGQDTPVWQSLLIPSYLSRPPLGSYHKLKALTKGKLGVQR